VTGASILPSTSSRKDKEYEITAELPGIDEKDVGHHAERSPSHDKGREVGVEGGKEKDYYLSERRFGSFQRSFQVPEGVDADKIEATFAEGVLTVRLPKTAQAKQAEKKISVKGA